MQLKINLRICDEDGQRFMGTGPYALLRGVQKYGSIRKAAFSMAMSYAKAHRILSVLEKKLGFKLLTKHIGGSDHGGATLTPQALQFLEAYESMKRSLQRAADADWKQFCEKLASLRETNL